MNIKAFAKKAIMAVILPAMLLTGCNSENAENTANPNPAEVRDAVVNEIALLSAAPKNVDELEFYYGDIDSSKVEDAAFCLSVGHPDEIAIIKFKSADDAKAAESALKKRVEKQIETFKDYDPDNMYKLETAKVYVSGKYAVLLAVDDNDKAKSIVDGKLAG